MEKSSNTVAKRFCFGLLVCAIILLSQELAAQSQRRFLSSDAEKLLVVPTQDVLFTNESNQFVLQIPNVASSEVLMELPKLPEGITFDSSRREDFIDSNTGTRGTQIDLWFTFRKEGEFILPPLEIYVQSRRYFINFKTVQVYENLKTILPRVSVVFDDGETVMGSEKPAKKISFEVGKPVCFKIYLQYGVQLQQFAWIVPKDALFKELARYELGAKRTSFSPERIPIAYFEWIPLAEGKTTLPEIRIMATAYSGHAVHLTMPDCVVQILAPSKKSGAQKNSQLDSENSIFAYAFSKDETAHENFENSNFSVEDFFQIAQLRSIERHSFFSANARAQRVVAEKQLGIQNSPNEPNLPLFILFASFFVLFTVLVVLLIVLRKKHVAAIFASLALVFAFFTVMLSHEVFYDYAIVVGGNLCPVPEDSALTKTQVGAGSRVRIREEIDKWYYIEYNENRGWIKKENLVLVK